MQQFACCNEKTLTQCKTLVNPSNTKKIYVFLDLKGRSGNIRNYHSEEVIEDCIPE